MNQLCWRLSLNSRGQLQYVVIFRRAFKLDLNAGHDKEQAQFFHTPIISTLASKEFRSSHFKIGQVVGMMQQPHSVGFAVTDSDFRRVLCEMFWHGRIS